MTEANELLIENLQNQLDRVVEQLKDLEDCKNEISPDEFDVLKEETVEQIREFSETLDRMQKGDTSIHSKLSTMKMAIRNAIASSFNTDEMIKLFGAQGIAESELRLQQLEEDFKLKKIERNHYENHKINILNELEKQGCKFSPENIIFLESYKNSYMDRLEQVED